MSDPNPTGPWKTRIEALHARIRLEAGADSSPSDMPKGRVLRVKFGYNPNSSSVGSVVTILMWTAAFGAIALNVAAALVRQSAHRALVDDGSRRETESAGMDGTSDGDGTS